MSTDQERQACAMCGGSPAHRPGCMWPQLVVKMHVLHDRYCRLQDCSIRRLPPDTEPRPGDFHWIHQDPPARDLGLAQPALSADEQLQAGLRYVRKVYAPLSFTPWPTAGLTPEVASAMYKTGLTADELAEAMRAAADLPIWQEER